MADVRCPMCGKTNPDTNAECQHCGSRLTPLVVTGEKPGPADQTLVSRPAPAPPAPGASQDVTVLRRSLRDSLETQPEADEAEDDPAGAEGSEQTPDWLQRLRTQTGSPSPGRPPSGGRDPSPTVQSAKVDRPPLPEPLSPDEQKSERRRTTGELFRSLRTAAMRVEEDEPEAESPSDELSGDVPDWLSTLRKQSVALPEPEPPDRTEPPPAVRDNWIQSLREHVSVPPVEEAAESPAEPALESTIARLPRSAPAKPPAESSPVAGPSKPEDDAMPDWLLAARPAQTEPDWPTPSGEAAQAGELPDWLKPATPGAAPAVEAEVGELPDWLRALGGPEAAPAAPAGDATDWPHMLDETPPTLPAVAGLPDWLDSLPSLMSDLTPPPEAPAMEAEAPPASGAGGAPMAPDWLTSLTFDTPTAQAQPIALEPPAERTPGQPETAVEESRPDDLPDWLEALRPSGAGPDVAVPGLPDVEPAPIAPPITRPAAPAGATPGDLERATLPDWLEAMRPMPVAQPSSPSSADYEETTGPLAGMKGVLAAEPAIALPTIRLSAADQPAVSEAQAAQVRVLEALVKEETTSHAAARKAGAQPILALFERWIVFAVLAAAVLAPFVLDSPISTFAPPSLFPAEAVAARDTVAGLPADRPVLVAVEYEPGTAGEMDLLAGALLDHLAGRGLRVAAISTRPLGPALAQAAIERSFGEATGAGGVPTERLYVNLGYLPGGVLGLPPFAADPRTVIVEAFGPPAEAPEASIWTSVVLGNVRTVADFGMIAVISSSPETAREWIEQSTTFGPPRPPMLALVSASAEPLVQPYFVPDAASSPLQGLVSGQFGAASYRQLVAVGAGGPPPEAAGVAAHRWDGQGFGLLAAVVLIGLGGLIFGAFSLLQRRGANPA